MSTTPSSLRVSRFLRLARVAALGALPLALLGVSSDAKAQSAGTNAKPLPNVLLLVDTSGSMERMPDNSLPSANRAPAPQPFNACSPGSPTNPNRWGMLLQALTGNMQPYYSCDAVDRSSPRFTTEFKIAGVKPYDAGYFLPYHRPLTGATAATACTFAPSHLPGIGTGSGVGPGNLGEVGASDASDFPPNAFTQVFNTDLVTAYTAGSPLAADNTCTFEQAADGQLDAAKDYVRFGLMTFDNDTDPGIGVTTAVPPSGSVLTANPFLGQWSYVKSAANPLLSSTPSALGFGNPAGCTTGAVAFEVGARHQAAPPWEGRMVNFPPVNGTLFDLETTNDQIQKVLLGTRPYGATPIEGMLEDARDYLLYNPLGPSADPYVTSGCRDQYIILLTDGAPNLDLRPACQGIGPPAGQCPYNKSTDIVNALALLPKPIKTYVIGFSVNGAGDPSIPFDGFPAPGVINNCKAWYASFAPPKVQSMHTACYTGAGAPTTPVGSTAEACCKLNEIAYWGDPSRTTGPFFAETQADIVLSFGRILGGVSKSATTRTLPGYSNAVTIGGVNTTGQFVASFIPNALKVWSGEIDRTRSICGGVGGIVPTPQTQDPALGDSYADNLAAQAITGKRIFISVLAQATVGASGTVIDSARTIRPYAAAAPTDGLNSFVGQEVASASDDLLKNTTNWAQAMDIAPNVNGTSPSCKRSKGVLPGGATADIPALPQSTCKDVLWDFQVATSGAINVGGWNFNVRCASGAGNLSAGFCSVSGAACSLTDPAACTASAATLGEVCVPACSALGGIYRSSPALVGTPNQYLRDDAYQAFATLHATRRQTMYVASMDGILHAFKALATNTFDAGNFEMWAFVPPAVLPKIATNYPSGQQILLDGTPVIKDTVWDRAPADPVSADQYHTTLVAGMGAGGAGYYALNVTDADCDNGTNFAGNSNACQGRFVAASSKPTAFAAAGPHFLWQLTDMEQAPAGDPAKPSRVARDGTQIVSLFGAQSGTPAIATLQMDPGDGNPRQIGVAILPGGIDGPPVKGGSCPRAVGTTFTPVDYDFSATGYGRRAAVRQWGATCAAPVPGRGVTIVRLDTGEILRHFGRATQDVPKKILGKTTDSPFDSPVIGTPAIYPNAVGATTQKIFVGDADGTVWRIDVSSPDPTKWKVTLFQDLVNGGLPGPATFAESQPIALPMVLSQDPTGNLVVNVATGDQENLVVSAEKNYVYSIVEQRPTTVNTPGYALVNWYKPFAAAERVTGPMTLFDRTLYFASYKPAVPAAGACGQGGTASLWGLDFVTPGVGGVTAGGAPRWCPLASGVDPNTQACAGALVQGEPVADPALAGAIIPGVTVQAAQSCASFGGLPGDPVLSGLTSTSYQIFFGATTTRGAGAPTGTPQAERRSIARPLPRTTASIDAWALVVD